MAKFDKSFVERKAEFQKAISDLEPGDKAMLIIVTPKEDAPTEVAYWPLNVQTWEILGLFEALKYDALWDDDDAE
jgi:hypothetical protein